MIELKKEMGITQIREISEHTVARIFGFIMYTTVTQPVGSLLTWKTQSVQAQT